MRTFRREPLNEVEGPEFEAESQVDASDVFDCASMFSQVTAEQEFELYSKVCDVLFQQKRSLEMIKP